MADLNAEDKLKQICDALRLETLKPAEDEAAAIVHNANERAQRIIHEAKEEAERIVAAAKEEADRQLKQGESALVQAGRRSIESLKQAIEQQIFKVSLAEWLEKATSDADVSAQLLTALVEAIRNQGVSGDLTAYIGKHVEASAVNSLLGKKVQEQLRGQSVAIGDFVGGVQLRVEEKNWVLDLSSDTLLGLLTRYLQKDFRKMIFQDS